MLYEVAVTHARFVKNMKNVIYKRSLEKEPIRVLVVDDSAFMRNTIAMMLMKFPDIQVVGTAQTGPEALDKVAKITPDIMTLDVQMPEMTGLEVLERVMKVHPLPVVMVSSLTQEGAEETFQALLGGAFDFIPKHQGRSVGDFRILETRLYESIKTAFENKDRFLQKLATGEQCLSATSKTDFERDCATKWNSSENDGVISQKDHTGWEKQEKIRLVIIGGSTGAPPVLWDIIQHFPSFFPATVLIVQHMPRFFTTVLAGKLEKLASIPIKEAKDGERLIPGFGYIAPGDRHVTLLRETHDTIAVKVSKEPRHFPYWPSVDLAMHTAAQHFGREVLGVILSGMGRDGVEGCRSIKTHGGKVLVQDEQSSTVFGMNRAVWEAGLGDEAMPGTQLGKRVVEMVRNH